MHPIVGCIGKCDPRVLAISAVGIAVGLSSTVVIS